NQDVKENENFETSFIEKIGNNNPITKIKIMMKWEFVATWVFIILLIAFPILSPIKNKTIQLFIYVALNLAVLTTLFYHFLFYRIYNNGLVQASNSFMHLVEFIAESKVALNLYRSYNYTMVVFLVPAVLLYRFKHSFAFIDTITTPMLWMIVFFTSLAIILVIIFCEVWINYYYGKHLKELLKIKSLFYN
ncbi:MAG: hypothetical protein ACK43K_00645, partial [Chitinophagales bacterium]